MAGLAARCACPSAVSRAAAKDVQKQFTSCASARGGIAAAFFAYTRCIRLRPFPLYHSRGLFSTLPRSLAPPCSEEALFKAGYAHGREDALAGIEGEVSRATRAAYGALVFEEEAARAASLDAAVLALERAHPRPPVRAAACATVEAELLACAPGAYNGHCAAPARAYVLCADRVLFRMMHPAAAAAPLE